MEDNFPPKPTPSSKLRLISDTASLAVTTVILLGVYVTSYLAATGAGSVFENTTAQVSDKYFTQVSQADFYVKMQVTRPFICSYLANC